MSCCYGSRSRDGRPGTAARVLVTELSRPGNRNPNPVIPVCEIPVAAEDADLSLDKLESIRGTQDLSHMTSLEICIDTQEKALDNFGVYLPKLVQLRMNNSIINSVRDLGTSLSHLQVMWMSRCCLQDLDGISIFTFLKELYVAYNSLSDLSQVSLLENLQLLDLEGNCVDDLVQVQYLGFCSKLQRLTLEGNPVCLHPSTTSTKIEDYRYRAAVRELVPQLRYLDDVEVEVDGQSGGSTMGKDWDILQNSVKDCNNTLPACKEEETADGVQPYSRHRRPASSISCFRPPVSAGLRPPTGSRPQTMQGPILSPPGSRSGSAGSRLAAVEAESSVLIHGAGSIVFCGNPVQALRAKREKLRTAPSQSSFNTRILPFHVPEHTYDLEEPDFTKRENVFAELRAWREQHSRRLQVIERERLPEVLAIRHDEEEGAESDDDDEEEGFAGMKSNSSDEEHREDKSHRDPQSPDSSFQSPSPDLLQRELLSPDLAHLSLSQHAPLSCHPPTGTGVSCSNQKLTGFRARRLRLRQVCSKHSPEISTPETSPDSDPGRILQMRKSNEHKAPITAHGDGLKDSCERKDFRRPKHVTSTSTATTRPHTARAALLKHHRPNPPPPD